MKKNLTEIVFILDCSGSMAGLTADTIGGFNSLLDKQKKEDGEAYVSTLLFNHEVKVVHDRLPIDKVNAMTGNDYVPMGCTALFDAVGGAIKHIGNIHKYARTEDVPEKTLFVITTDGMENASRNFSGAEIKKLIERQREQYGWEFIFLGANIDAAETAENIGICRENAVNYKADRMGTDVLYNSVNAAVSCMRSAPCLSKGWRKDLDEDVKRRGK